MYEEMKEVFGLIITMTDNNMFIAGCKTKMFRGVENLK